MYLITGHTGFIGSALKKKIESFNLDIVPVEANSIPRIHADYFFHFGSPSSQVLFAEDDGCISDTITDFIKVVEYCKRRRVKLVFPSSANVYLNNNAYAHTKSALEQIADAYGVDYVGYRIFCGYGPGEKHKKDYASVAYQWTQDIRMMKQPIIYGDGTQTRDFVFIDDIVQTILNTHEIGEGYIDIGTGIDTSFNELIEIINKITHRSIQPIYEERPKNYVDNVKCRNPLLTFTPLEDGIRQILTRA